MIFSNHLNDLQEKIFDLILIISYILIFISYFNLSDSAPTYLETLDYYIKIYICLFLIWRFNPFRKVNTFTDLDRKISFSAGMFIITTTTLNQYLTNVKDKASQILKPV